MQEIISYLAILSKAQFWLLSKIIWPYKAIQKKGGLSSPPFFYVNINFD